MPHERLAALRERLQRRRRKRAAKRRARARSERRGGQARERAARERRLAEGRPEGLREELTLARQEASGVASEASAVVSEERAFLAAELGVSQSDAQAIAERGMEVLSAANRRGQLEALDVDGDGDADLVRGLDPVAVEEPRSVVVDPTDPVIEFAGVDTPLFAEGNRGVSLDEPTPGEVGKDDVLR